MSEGVVLASYSSHPFCKVLEPGSLSDCPTLYVRLMIHGKKLKTTYFLTFTSSTTFTLPTT